MKNRKKNTKLVLLLLLVCITLGYAALRTGLNINGTANVASSSWNVYFSNYQMSNATNITPTTEPVITGTTTTSISYEVDLDVPGDIYEFSVEVVNGGSLDANISLVSKYNGSEIGPTNPIPEYITYTVTDENGDPIVDNHRLNHGDSEIVKVYVKYKDDDASVLPAQDVPGLSFDIEIEATQAEKEPAETGVYTVQSDAIYIGQTIPNTITTYSTPAEAMAVFSNRPFYLKHVLNDSDNTVAESYVGFVVTDALKAQWKEDNCSGDSECEAKYDNLVNGTYYLRGGLSTQPVYEANKSVIKQAFNYTVQPDICSDYSSDFYCDVSGLDAGANSLGGVYADDGSASCYVNSDGYSYCIE